MYATAYGWIRPTREDADSTLWMCPCGWLISDAQYKTVRADFGCFLCHRPLAAFHLDIQKREIVW
jgi:hypothetical protein